MHTIFSMHSKNNKNINIMNFKTDAGFPIIIPCSFNGYKVIKRLASGSTSVVVLVEKEISQETFVAKIISKEDSIKQDFYELTMNEINVQKTLSHPHIVKLQESFEIKNEGKEYIVIIMEYCENGDLFSYVMNQKECNESQLKKIIIGFLEAVQYLHHKGISHGDIKSENVLLDSNFSPKLCDFGFCNTNLIADDDSKNGTLCYSAPELFTEGKYNTLKVDIYAIGITLYSLAVFHFPFKDGDDQSIVKQIVANKLSISNKLDNQLRQLVIRCTDKEPMNRPTISEILNDPYFNNMNCNEKDNNNLKTVKKIPSLLCDANNSEEKLKNHSAKDLIRLDLY